MTYDACGLKERRSPQLRRGVGTGSHLCVLRRLSCLQSTREQHRTAWEHGIAEKKRLGKMQKYWVCSGMWPRMLSQICWFLCGFFYACNWALFSQELGVLRS